MNIVKVITLNAYKKNCAYVSMIFLTVNIITYKNPYIEFSSSWPNKNVLSLFIVKVIINAYKKNCAYVSMIFLTVNIITYKNPYIKFSSSWPNKNVLSLFIEKQLKKFKMFRNCSKRINKYWKYYYVWKMVI